MSGRTPSETAALAENAKHRQAQLADKRESVLRLRRLDPELGYESIGRRVGIGRIQVRRWCIEAGLERETPHG